MNKFMPAPETDEANLKLEIATPSSRSEQLLWNLLAEASKAISSRKEEKEITSWLISEVGFSKNELSDLKEKGIFGFAG